MEKVEGQDKVSNTTMVFGPDGEEITRYRKIHLFDIHIEGKVAYQESAFVEAGGTAEVGDVFTRRATGLGKGRFRSEAQSVDQVGELHQAVEVDRPVDLEQVTELVLSHIEENG